MGNNKLSSKGTSLLLEIFKQGHSMIRELNLSGYQIDDECIKQLGEYMQKNKYLEILYINKNNISDEGIAILAKYMIGNNKLKFLDISENIRISDKGIEILAEQLHGNETLMSLCFNKNLNITDKSVPALIKMVELSHIQYLPFSLTSIQQNYEFVVPLAKNAIKCKSNDIMLSCR